MSITVGVQHGVILSCAPSVGQEQRGVSLYFSFPFNPTQSHNQSSPTSMVKDIVVDNAPKRIKFLQFGILSPQEIVAISEFEANTRDLYQIDEKQPAVRKQAPNGVLDLRLVRLP